MTRCPEYYDKWEKDPNWCDLCPSAVSQINSYIKLIDELEVAGLDRKFTMVKLPERVARPLFSMKAADTKVKIVKDLVEYLNRPDSKKLNAQELRSLIDNGTCCQSEPQPITIKIQQNEKKIKRYQNLIRSLQQENEMLRKRLPQADALMQESFGVTEKPGSMKTIGHAAALAKLAIGTLGRECPT